jgi:hypothetical protein
VTDSDPARPPGFVPASIAAGVAFATAATYVIVIVSQGETDPLAVSLITGYFVGLGVCALVGGSRRRASRVILLGAATGGLIGAAIVALFSIGFLLLIAGICALFAWMRASVEASPRDRLYAGAAALGAPLVFLALVLLV